MIMTNHVRNDRADRMTYIALTIGFGEIMQEFVDQDRKICLTSTGVIMVKGMENDVLITAYICDIHKVTALYRSIGCSRMPDCIYRTVLKNRIHLKRQNEIIF